MQKYKIRLLVIASMLCLSGCCLSHEWRDATCMEPKTCIKCGEIEGESLGHIWEEVTCTTPKTCMECAETEGEALGHKWQNANCRFPKTCSLCGETEGNIGEHIWTEATCLTEMTCTICGEATGGKASHTYNENGTCTVCGTIREIQLTMDNVDDFLSITDAMDFEADTFYKDSGHLTITVTISPVSNDYIFQDVKVRIGHEWQSVHDGTIHHDPWYYNRETFHDVDSNGNLVLVVADKYWDYQAINYNSIKRMTIYDVKGSCILK